MTNTRMNYTQADIRVIQSSMNGKSAVEMFTGLLELVVKQVNLGYLSSSSKGLC